jgi:hypothetical protein
MKVAGKLIVISLLLILFTAGCGLFRKKNRCHTCPAWNKVENVHEQNTLE